MFSMFTERARKVVALAQEAARESKHDFIGVRHLLIGLLREESGVAARALRSLGWKEGTFWVEQPAEGTEVAPEKIPFTPRAKKVLERALREALSLGHNYIGTEHILLAITNEEGKLWEGVFTATDAGAISDAVRMMVDPGWREGGDASEAAEEKRPLHEATIDELRDRLTAVAPPWGNPNLLARDVEEGFWIAFEVLKRLETRGEFDSTEVGDLLKVYKLMSELHKRMTGVPDHEADDLLLS